MSFFVAPIAFLIPISFILSDSSKTLNDKTIESVMSKLLNLFKSIQYSSNYKKKKSKFIIKNNFTKKGVKKEIKNILKNI